MSDTVFAKNQLLPLTIESLASDGSGVGRAAGGMAVFLPGGAPGDVVEVGTTSRRLPDNEDHFAIGGVIDGEREELPA